MRKEIQTIFQSIEKSLLETFSQLKKPETDVYACGFWLFYCDYTILGQPCLAYNIAGNENHAKWSPPEWIVDVDENVIDTLTPYYEKINKLMHDQDDKSWEELMQYQYDFYSNLCFNINNQIKKGDSPFSNFNLTKDFIIGIFEERESEEIYHTLAIASIGESAARELGVI